MTESKKKKKKLGWWAVGGAVGCILILGWILWRIDVDRLRQVVVEADSRYIFIILFTLAAEQLLRGWKWRQLLFQIKPIPTLRLFGAIMAGYFANIVIPLGISPLVRSWLVARQENLRVGTVLATAAIDRLVDGVVFAGFVALALGFTTFPDPDGNLRTGLMVGGLGSLVLFAFILFALARWKQKKNYHDNWTIRFVGLFADRLTAPLGRFLGSFNAGIVWPEKIWRSTGIIFASIGIKLIATTHFLWAGLAFGVVLRPAEYVFLLVFLGFLIILTRAARVPGGFLVGGVFALDLLNVAEEQALAMVLLVHFATLITVSCIGAFTFWRNGIAITDLRSFRENSDKHP